MVYLLSDANLSDNQKAILDFIKSSFELRDTPSVEIRDQLGLNQLLSTDIWKSSTKGYIKRDPTKPRAIKDQ